MNSKSLQLSLLKEHLAICRLGASFAIPDWAKADEFLSITKTADELSIICNEANVPDYVVCDKGYRALKFEGPFDFSMTGILIAIANPLAEAEIPVLALATYDTDYILIKKDVTEAAINAIVSAGHKVSKE
ncbi:MAG: ACT domain-containing protein [Alphaproteobacteria bacterium]|nr:ACT domain-containing protein [Alphaproteobacteria bacterium]